MRKKLQEINTKIKISKFLNFILKFVLRRARRTQGLRDQVEDHAQGMGWLQDFVRYLLHSPIILLSSITRLNGAGAAVQTKRFAGADLRGNKYFHVLDEADQWKRIVCTNQTHRDTLVAQYMGDINEV